MHREPGETYEEEFNDLFVTYKEVMRFFLGKHLKGKGLNLSGELPPPLYSSLLRKKLKLSNLLGFYNSVKVAFNSSRVPMFQLLIIEKALFMTGAT